jgi:hypothetical protein
MLLFNVPALLIYEGNTSFWGIPKFLFRHFFDLGPVIPHFIYYPKASL